MFLSFIFRFDAQLPQNKKNIETLQGAHPELKASLAELSQSITELSKLIKECRLSDDKV